MSMSTFGRIVEMREQFVAGCRTALVAALVELLLQARRGQLGDDDQVAVDALDPLQREQERDGGPA